MMSCRGVVRIVAFNNTDPLPCYTLLHTTWFPLFEDTRAGEPYHSVRETSMTPITLHHLLLIEALCAQSDQHCH